MIMNSFLYLAVALLLISFANGRAIDEIDNSLQNDEGGSLQAAARGDWVKITERPPAKIVQPLGTSIELECEVTGSPPPTIHWIRGSNPQNSINDFETNLIDETSPSSLVRVRSRLIVDHVVPTERTFTCVGRSGAKTVYAATTVYSAPGNILKPHNITELLALNSNLLSGPKKARIILYYSVIFENIGTNVILPCKAAGRPHPELYWMDADENIVNGQDSRFRVLPTGELLISSLRWSDMGTYTCIARNPLAKDSISTFVYPVLNEE